MVRTSQFKLDAALDSAVVQRLDECLISTDLVNIEHLTVEEVRQVAGLTIQA